MLCGLLKPTEGSARVNGFDLQHAPSKARSQIGYMAQKFSLYGNLSVHANLQFFSGAYNLMHKERKEAIEEMIEIFFVTHNPKPPQRECQPVLLSAIPAQSQTAAERYPRMYPALLPNSKRYY